MFYILFGCFYSSFNYTFVEEVEMNPNQINETEGAHTTTGHPIAKISSYVFFIFFIALKLLLLDWVLHFGRPFFYGRPAAQSLKYFSFKSRSTSSLLCGWINQGAEPREVL